MTKKADKKTRKPKLTRDSFTMPSAEYAAFDAIKKTALQTGKAVKKTEILRAGLMLLSTLDAATLVKVLDAVPNLKTGRPAKAAPTVKKTAPAAKTAPLATKKPTPAVKKAPPAAKKAAPAMKKATPAAKKTAPAERRPVAAAAAKPKTASAPPPASAAAQS